MGYEMQHSRIRFSSDLRRLRPPPLFAMPSLDCGPLGHVCLEWPQATLRAFGAPPYLRLMRMPHLESRAIALRAGSFFLWFVHDARARAVPFGLLIELRLVPGHSMRIAWLRGRALALRDELFPRR